MSESTANKVVATDASEGISKSPQVEKSAAQRIKELMDDPNVQEELDELPETEQEVKVEEVKAEEEKEEEAPEEATETEEETEEEVVAEKPEEPSESELQKAFKEHPRLLAIHLANKKKREDAREAQKKAEFEAERLKNELEVAKVQLSQATRPVPTPNDPLADVYDDASLRKVERQFEEIIELAEKNPDGAYDVVVGQNKDGTDKKRDFTREQLIDMKIVAQRGLRRDIPQRQVYLAQRAQMDAEAVKIYPEIQDKNSELSRFIQAVSQADPILESRIGPEFKIWLGHAFTRRQQWIAEQNGSAKKSTESVRKIVSAKKTEIAPSKVKQRGDLSISGEAEIEAAKKKMAEEKNEDSLAEFFKAKREAKSRQVAVS